MRLIDADALKLDIDCVFGGDFDCLIIDSMIDDMPTVDAVPVVRCKDCRFFEYDHFDSVYIPTETGEAKKMPLITAHEICTKWGDGCKTAEDGYCFLGERKEE